MSDLIERAKKCANDDVGSRGRYMITELIDEIIRLNEELVGIAEDAAGEDI